MRPNHQYVVKVRHDRGFASLRINGENKDHAAARVAAIEHAPIGAVVSVKRIYKNRRAAP